MTDDARLVDVERQRQKLLPAARERPMLSRLVDAILNEGAFGDDRIAVLRAAATAEEIVLAGPRSLYEAEPGAIASYPDAVAAYRAFVDRLDGHTQAVDP
jgi:hypothetical protein